MAAKRAIGARGGHAASRDSGRSSPPDSDPAGSRGIGRKPGFGASEKAAKDAAKRVAIVDNEDELCSLFSMLVERLGYRVEYVAHDGDEIVRAVSEGDARPDLILMDYRMPGMNGIQASKKVLRILPETKIILATADDSVRRDAISAGLTFLLKPFSTPDLLRSMQGALGRPKSPGPR